MPKSPEELEVVLESEQETEIQQINRLSSERAVILSKLSPEDRQRIWQIDQKLKQLDRILKDQERDWRAQKGMTERRKIDE